MEKKNNRFSPLEKHKIMDLKSKGYGYKAIATRLGLSCDAVKSFIRRHKDDPQYLTYLRNYEEVRPLIFDTACFDAEITELQEEMTVTAELIQKCVDENARTAINQDKYKKKYDALVKRFEKAKQRLQEIHDTKRDREARRLQTDHFMRELKKQESIITEFDEVFWYTLVDRITIYNETDIRFTFKDGTEYRV